MEYNLREKPVEPQAEFGMCALCHVVKNIFLT